MGFTPLKKKMGFKKGEDQNFISPPFFLSEEGLTQKHTE
jgi:hypothetical protein